MLIGSITNWGEIQGQINDANGYLTGFISNAELIGGEIVGLRGLQGEQGEQGETGVGIQSVAKTSSSGLVDTYTITFTDGTTTTYTMTNGQDGADGADGFSPSASVSKVGSVATITITDKDGTTTASVSDGENGIFIATYGVTTFNEISSALSDGKFVFALYGLAYYPLIYLAGGTTYTFSYSIQDTGYFVTCGISNTWSNGSTQNVTLVKQNGTSVTSYGIANVTTHDVPSGGTSGQVLAKDSNDDYDVSWVNQSGGGASAFIAEYGVTTYADVKDAYDEDAIILCTVDDSGNTVICQLAYYDDENGIFYFAQPRGDGFYLASIAIDDTWDDGYFQFASTDTATQLRNGLMDALDKQKLDTIASGAEVNVQSDWNEADNTADDYIKNKPTIPTVNNATLTIQKNGTTVNTFTANASSNVTADISVPTDTGDLTNGAGFITGVTSTSTPTASTIAEFDNDAQLNSTDMSSQDVSDFVDGLNTSALSVAQVIADMFVTSSHSISLGTISGNSYSASSASVTKSGYTPIGIVGFRIQSSWIQPSRIQITEYNDGSATVSWEMRNYASGSANISLIVEILWRKTV